MALAVVDKNGKRTSEVFDPKHIGFRPAKVLDHGGKIIGVTYKGGPLRLQTPEMLLPYGVSVFEDKGTGNVKYSVDFSFRGMEENERLKKFHEQIEGLQAAIIQAAIDNTQAWFRKSLSAEVITEFFTSILKKSVDKETGEPNGKYPDTIKAKLDLDREGNFRCKAYGPDHSEFTEPLDSLLVKGTLAKAMLLPSFIWFAGGKFGITIKAEQMRVKLPPKRNAYAFVPDDDDDEVDEDTEKPSGDGFVSDEDADADGGEGSDGGDGEEEVAVPEPAPAPAPAPARRGGRRRKADA